MDLLILACYALCFLGIGTALGSYLRKRRHPPITRVWAVSIDGDPAVTAPNLVGPFFTVEEACRWETCFNQTVLDLDLHHRMRARNVYMGAHLIPKDSAEEARWRAQRLLAGMLIPADAKPGRTKPLN